MDKETLSNYGWIIICILILVVLMALAGPFGNFIAEGVKATTVGFCQTSEKALEVSEVHVSKSKWQVSPDESRESEPLYFEKAYVYYLEGYPAIGLSSPYEAYIFHKDGTVDNINYNGIYKTVYTIPAGYTGYEDGNIIVSIDEKTIEEGAETEKYPIAADKKSIKFYESMEFNTVDFVLEDICDHPNKIDEGATEYCPDCGQRGCLHTNQTQDKHGNVTCPDCGAQWKVPV
jgi:predicted RNA-binding Zn-ribbon protein involved in translation (DUF1610 family)